MKFRTLLIVGASVVAASLRAVGEPASAADARSTPPAGAQAHAPDTELEGHMKKIGRAFRALNKSVSDPAKNEDSLKQAGIIRAQAEAAVTLKPAKTADLPEDQQAKFVDDYRQDMKNFLADVISLESALKANDNQQAKELVAKMKQDMKHGHKEYKKKKDDM